MARLRRASRKQNVRRSSWLRRDTRIVKASVFVESKRRWGRESVNVDDDDDERERASVRGARGCGDDPQSVGCGKRMDDDGFRSVCAVARRFRASSDSNQDAARGALSKACA